MVSKLHEKRIHSIEIAEIFSTCNEEENPGEINTHAINDSKRNEENTMSITKISNGSTAAKKKAGWSRAKKKRKKITATHPERLRIKNEDNRMAVY